LQSWTYNAPNKLSWQRVDTDALNFTLLLTNQDRSVMPTDNQELAALVDGTLGTLSVNPPATDLPIGKGFRLNLVKDTEHESTIYAQSGQFSIVQASSSSSVSGSSTKPAGTTTIPPYVIFFFVLVYFGD
jgi:hypothetical protein